MKVLLDVDRKYEETHVTIHCREMDDTIKQMLDFLKERETEFIVGKKGEEQHILKPDTVHHFHTEKEVVIATTAEGSFKVKEKLYELEEMLPSTTFIRLSKSVLANLYEIRHFEPSFNGTLAVHFQSGNVEYASRHYVGKMKEILKLNRRNA
ncbi:LytTR family transcriptional regulator DNA-binding domain-containing protein [Halobacillus litoralis]|uniref:LytTR family DNA-binding domain-containing protein n=1 Tax=Halobacillus litoralis TaxID=45668 RepID=UPI001CD26F33|nr:LytTR family DNA-binding domain-containing protein [Halobacillus litoralis]MCA0972070.1 LytTR family transcriptional regulator DNA-binding domain-containing protein [Halobacillus litoralis]